MKLFETSLDFTNEMIQFQSNNPQALFQRSWGKNSIIVVIITISCFICLIFCVTCYFKNKRRIQGNTNNTLPPGIVQAEQTDIKHRLILNDKEKKLEKDLTEEDEIMMSQSDDNRQSLRHLPAMSLGNDANLYGSSFKYDAFNPKSSFGRATSSYRGTNIGNDKTSTETDLQVRESHVDTRISSDQIDERSDESDGEDMHRIN